MHMQKPKLKLNQKQLVLVLFVMGAVILLLGIIPCAVLLSQKDSLVFRSAFFKVMTVLILGVMILLGGCLIVDAFLRSRQTDAHFFRYDPELKRNIPLEDLTFDRVNRRMSAELRSMIGTSYMPEIWLHNIFRESNQSFGADEVLAPMVAYKMLYELVASDREEDWQLFTHADEELIRDLLKQLQRAGETRMTRDLMGIYEDAEQYDSTENIRNFLTGNCRYLQRRMLEYAKMKDPCFY